MPSALFTHQRYEFERQFRSQFGDGFQDWFAKVFRHLHPPGNVQSVRLTQGDGKLDVVVLGEQAIYQCYGPQTWPAAEAAAKIRRDFQGAREFLEGRMRKWVFVHNHPTGCLDKLGIKALNDLVTESRKHGDATEILAWGMEELWEVLEEGLPHSALQELFGAPNPVHVDFASLEGLLLTLERADYSNDATPVPSPAPDKLEFNALGPSYRLQIQQGRGGVGVMEGYLASRFASDPEFGERLAQRFRNRYDQIRRRSELSPDDIYEKLRLDAGWKASPDVKREMATRIVLAYFFDSCDIFENPLNKP